MNHDYIFFLEDENDSLSNHLLTLLFPKINQSRVYADGQGAIIKQFGLYRDIHSEPIRDEKGIFDQIIKLTGEQAVTAEGVPFKPRPYVDHEVIWKSMPITGFSPTSTNAGTVNPNDFITIQGSGLGSPGNVFYANADNGGSNLVTSNVPSDYVSWSPTEIVAKVPDEAGTGNITVQPSSGPTSSSSSPLNVYYNHLSVYSEFQGFPELTRQRVNLMNINGNGGYDMLYNNSFDSNTAAKASFERALETWQCDTGLNFEVAGTTPINSSGSDNTNVVFFNSALPAGVLGQTSSFYSGFAISGCVQENTVWFLREFDIAFRPNPGSGSWNFGPESTPSNQFDFESVALHELGHAHGLGHVIDNNAVMHWSLSNGTDQRELSPSEIDGGLAKITDSEDICFVPTGTLGSMIPLSPSTCDFLPVELISFTAKRKNANTNELTWIVNEYNNQFYDILRSDDGFEFENIGEIKAHNLQNNVEYNWIDNDTKGLSWYYKIKQTDRDGQFKYLGIRYIEGPIESEPKVWIDGNNHIKVAGHPNFQNRESLLQLFTIDGKVIYNGPLNGGTRVLDQSRLPAGLFLYRIISGPQIYSGKIVSR